MELVATILDSVTLDFFEYNKFLQKLTFLFNSYDFSLL